MSDRCPEKDAQPEVLLDLLDAAHPGAGTEELQRHVAGCAACGAALAALREGFAVLSPLGNVQPDPAALARIEAGVLAALAAPARPARLRLLFGGAFAVALTALCLSTWAWPLGHPLADPLRGAAFALVPLLLFVALSFGKKGRQLALLLGLGLSSLLAVSDVSGVVVPLLSGLPCLMIAASGTILPAATLWLFCGPERRSLLGGAILGAAVFAGGLAAQTALCDLGGVAHVLALHLAPLLLGTSAVALLGWRASFSPALPAPARSPGSAVRD